MSAIPLKIFDQAQKAAEHVNRACEPCRLLKVRCLPSPDPLSTRCQRCSKTGRTCHYAAPQKRRPRKRTDTRVAELEREVRAMRSLLNKSKQSPSGESNQSPIETLEESDEHGDSTRKTSASTHINSEETRESDSSSPLTKKLPYLPPTGPCKTHGTGNWTDIIDEQDSSDTGTEPCPDVIDRDVINLPRALKFIAHYNENMQKHAPFHCSRPDETAEWLRANKPILFLTILTAVAGQKDVALYDILHDELLRVFADRYILNCEKSLELVQAFMITAIWLYPPNDFRALKFYQYIHMAAAMALDIGYAEAAVPGQKYWPAVPTEAIPASQDGFKHQEAFEDIETCYPTLPSRSGAVPRDEMSVVESRRTFLGCYLACSTTAMSLRRPNMFPYSSFIASCIDYLKKSPCALSSDKHLIAWVEMQRIAEECGNSFAFDDPTVPFSMSDPRMQLTLKGFENRLEDWKKATDPSAITPSLAMHYYQNKIFLQEFAMMVKNADDFQPPQFLNTRTAATKPISAASANAIMIVIESAHLLLDAMLSMPDDVMKSLPVICYVRMSYTVVLLIKMSAAATAPSSELGKILDVESLRVDHYLKAIISRLKNISDYRVANKFMQIVVKVAMWRHHHLAINGFKLGQGVQQLIKPLMNMVVEEGKNNKTKSKTMRNFFEAELDMQPRVHQEAPKDNFGNFSGPSALNLEAFSYEESAPSDPSSVSGNEPNYAQTMQPAMGPSAGMTPELPSMDGGLGAQSQWYMPVGQAALGLLPSEMDIDIFALSEGMEYSAADLSTWLPADDEGMYNEGFGNGQGWSWS